MRYLPVKAFGKKLRLSRMPTGRSIQFPRTDGFCPGMIPISAHLNLFPFRQKRLVVPALLLVCRFSCERLRRCVLSYGGRQ